MLTMREDIVALTQRVDAMPGAIMTQVRILHEDVISRLKIIQEGSSGS